MHIKQIRIIFGLGLNIANCLITQVSVANQYSCPSDGKWISNPERNLITPLSFKNEAKAKAGNCRLHRLKSKAQRNCVIEERDRSRGRVVLNIYDMNAKGEFIKTSEFPISSWFDHAKVHYQDILGNGQEFIIATFESGAATGVGQLVLAVAGWHNNKFLPVLIETHGYYQSLHTGYPEEILNVKYSFINNGSNAVSIDLQYNYSVSLDYFKDYIRKHPEHARKYPDLQSTQKLAWNNTLTWNDKTFSFYERQIEQKRLKESANPIEKSIAEIRLNSLKETACNFATELWKLPYMRYAPSHLRN